VGQDERPEDLAGGAGATREIQTDLAGRTGWAEEGGPRPLSGSSKQSGAEDKLRLHQPIGGAGQRIQAGGRDSRSDKPTRGSNPDRGRQRKEEEADGQVLQDDRENGGAMRIMDRWRMVGVGTLPALIPC
jgi:hypothetical protein